MTKIDIEQIKADREAGTHGPWHVIEDWYGEDVEGYNINSPCSEIIGCEGLMGCKEIDARRIARVPDMEDALIEVVELLESIRVTVEDSGFALDVDEFLERFK